ncbi:unnamed protein product [Pieris macdunnoughi]|uniref:CCHC-type domain-containing protein n=1 Tax=Pieris macdunnoughi TaxID=345717 RepID=A0A821WU79_9NEOP|nr:unnamed protein product [Pieris macdunnoughi]
MTTINNLINKKTKSKEDVSVEMPCDAAEQEAGVATAGDQFVLPAPPSDIMLECPEMSDSSTYSGVEARESLTVSSRFWSSRKRFREVADTDSDIAREATSKITRRKGRGRPSTKGENVDPVPANKSAKLKETRAEKKAREEEELLALEIKARETQCTLSSVLVSEQGEDMSLDLVKRIEASLGVVEKVATKSSNIKGQWVHMAKNAIADMRKDIGVLAKRSVSEETRSLREDNERLKKQIEILQQDMTDLRKHVGVNSKEPSLTPSLLEEFEANLMRRIGDRLNARFESLEPRLNPAPVLRPSLAADRRKVVGPPRFESGQSQTANRQVNSRSLVQAASTALPQGPSSISKKKKNKRIAGEEILAIEKVSAITQPSPLQSASNLSKEHWLIVGKGKKRKRKKRGRSGAVLAQPTVTGFQAPVKKPRLRTPRTAAVVVTVPAEVQKKGVTYAEAIKEAKGQIRLEELGIEAVRFRRAATGAAIIQVTGEGGGDKADVLAKKLRELYGTKGILVSRPVKSVEGECSSDHVRVGEVRQDKTGLFAVWVKCPVEAAKKLSEGRLLVGWTSARVTVLQQRELRCFRCLQAGHVAARCTAEIDRSKSCYRCGQPGHRASVCSSKPQCPLCIAAGKTADHRLGESLYGSQSKDAEKIQHESFSRTNLER